MLTFRFNPFRSLAILGLLAGGSLPLLWGRTTINLSLGSMPLVLLFFIGINKKILPQFKVQKFFLIFLLAIGSFIPFWKMWLEADVQRTSLILFIFGLALFPILSRNYKAFGFLLIFLTSLFLIPFTKLPTAKNPFKEQLYKSLQHGEDIPDVGRPGNFQFRNRTFWWNTAISDWKSNPVFGVGFWPEVPSFAKEGKPNDGKFRGDSDFGALPTPISGPHNSYLSVLARTGVIGLLLFFLLTFRVFQRIYHLWERRDLSINFLAISYVAISGLIYAAVNVGFETPYNSAAMYFCFGALFFLRSKSQN
ncbi:MAG: O-antigen ligase family protein [Bacteriovoracia bacterium]